MFGLDTLNTFLLLGCLLAACAFEFINGFHDTANAVATVIYTHSMKPTVAVIWSGIWNFIGVNLGGIAVAIGIINLLPLDVIIDRNLAHNIAMVLSLILTAIIWNLATWYIGIPCSSSHTLIGSIFGVGIAFMLLPGHHEVALNWTKVAEAGLSLLISPVFGFGLALLLMFILQKTIRNKDIFKEPAGKKPPPMWIRSILVLTCTSVSYAHGSNDGQKGVGLVMLILIAFAPAFFALDRSQPVEKLFLNTKRIGWTMQKADTAALSPSEMEKYHIVQANLGMISNRLKGVTSVAQLDRDANFDIRKSIFLISKNVDLILKEHKKSKKVFLRPGDISVLKNNIKRLRTHTEYAMRWVILMVSLSLGLGTMIGWKKIVVTIGERIGKTHLNYAQGASAQLIAASTITVSSMLGLPVSTTHVLSSGVAGAMVAGKGRQNLRMGTVKNILAAWIFTLPVTIILSGGLFILFRFLMH
ncbi:MAG: inorganic phosphate transporter [Bacteroidetes bacterium]|nr:inorganic phosphate transporter [Bacteroidota bacterium]